MEYNDRIILVEIRTKMRKMYMNMILYQYINISQDSELAESILLLSEELRDYQQICPDIWMHINFDKSVYRDAYLDLSDRIYDGYRLDKLSKVKNKPEDYTKDNIINRKFIKSFIDKHNKLNDPEYIKTIIDGIKTTCPNFDPLNIY